MADPELPHVLVADDDPVIVRLLDLNFRLGGFRVSSATRGDLAVDRALADEPDAIVLDVTMPGIDGYEVCRRLRDEHGMAEVPIVMLTAHAQDEDRDRGYALGIVAYVTKPFDPQDLVTTVRDALPRDGAP
jgi:DNA-binding response OmpR family regulator